MHRDSVAPPTEVQRIAALWGVELTERTHTRYSQTWFGRRGSEHVVVKVGGTDARRREAAALRAYAHAHDRPARDEQSSAAALNTDPPIAAGLIAEAEGALLLERILLGDDLRPLAASDDDAATATAGSSYARMHAAVAGVPRPDDLPDLRRVADAFDVYDARDTTAPGGRNPLPADLVARARDMLDELSMPADSDIVLHGDAHHQNLLRQGFGDQRDTWRVIDPHGWWGDPTFDSVALMLNLHGSLAMSRRDSSDLVSQARRRASILADTAGVDPSRLLAWTFVGGIIAELWCLADHGFVQGGPLKLAAALHGAGLA